MANQKEAIKAIRKAKNCFVNTRLTEHDMILTTGTKKDLIWQINRMVKLYGTTEFNVRIYDDGDVVIG